MIQIYISVLDKVLMKVRKRAKIRNRFNQAPHLTQDINWKVTNSQLDITNESQEVSPFPADDHNVISFNNEVNSFLHVHVLVPDLEIKFKSLNYITIHYTVNSYASTGY